VSHSVSRLRISAGWLATAALAAAMLAHAAGVISQAALDHVGFVSLGWIVFRLAGRRGAGTAALLAVAVGGGLAAVRPIAPDLNYMPYLLIIPANLAVAWLFASGLRPGREPILLRLILVMGVSPADDPAFRRFIARQCLLWAGLSLSNACLALAALLFVDALPWLAQLLAWLVAAQALWFVLSHRYASMRYGRPEGWWTTARAMIRPETWSRLRAS
jgi:hypothetical protein